MKKVHNKQLIEIPVIKVKHSLFSCLFPLILVGGTETLDKDSKFYIYLLVRLIDKSREEYMIAKEYIDEECKIGDKLAHRFQIINHLENCINSISRSIKIFDIIHTGKKTKKKVIINNNINLLHHLSKNTITNIKKYKISKIRNRIEHIDEDIYTNKFVIGLSVDVDDKYQNICINKKCISLIRLSKIILDYHNFVLEIFNNLPNCSESYEK
jgi:hypothetical protein